MRSARCHRSFALILCMGVWIPGTASAADDLGRLFTTPSERVRLDEARRGMHVAPAPAPVTAAVSATAAPVENPSALTLRGAVTREGGRSTAWVNDTNTYQGDVGAAHQQVDRAGIAGNEVTVRLPDGRSALKLKVGQTVDPASARVTDIAADAGQVPASPAQPALPDDDEE